MGIEQSLNNTTWMTEGSNRGHSHVLDKAYHRAPDHIVLVDVDLVEPVKESCHDRELEQTVSLVSFNRLVKQLAR